MRILGIKPSIYLKPKLPATPPTNFEAITEPLPGGSSASGVDATVITKPQRRAKRVINPVLEEDVFGYPFPVIDATSNGLIAYLSLGYEGDGYKYAQSPSH